MSDTTVIKKLRVKPGNRMLILNAPHRAPLDAPQDVDLTTEPGGDVDVVLAFYKTRAELDAELETLKSAMGADGILWVAYPKGTSKVPTDLNRDILRVHLEAEGLQAVAMVAIDDTWSAMRLKKV